MWNEKYRNRFIPAGRIGRKDFAKNLGFILLSAFLLFGMLMSVMEKAPILVPFGMVYFAILLWNLFCLIAKRLHDIGYSAWWLLAYWFGGLALSVIVSLISKNPIVDIATQAVITIAFYLILLLKQGQPTPNKFGEPV